MFRLCPLFGLVAAALAFARGEPLPDLPDPLGRAGMMAAVLHDSAGGEVIIAAGGTNFPDKKLWEGGQRKYHQDVFKLAQTRGSWAWTKIGDLHTGLVGAAFCPTPKLDGLIIAGGAAADGHRTEVWVVRLDGSVTRFAPNMPEPRAYAGFTSSNHNLILIGGITGPNDTTAIPTLTSLNLDEPSRTWRTSEADPAFARIIPLCGAGAQTMLWGGGCMLSAKEGKPFRTYQDNLSFKSASAEGHHFHGIPQTLAGAAGPGVATATHLFFVGGDDGSQYGHPYETHTGLGRHILALNLKTLKATIVGDWPHPVAVAPLVRLGDDLVTISGEIRPGIRTPKITRWTIPAEYR